MNFTLHIFGNPNGYKQFPVDSLNNNFQDYREDINSTDKLIYFRNGELVQYIYNHELNNYGSFFGMCLTFNGIICSEPLKLFELFKNIFSDILNRNKLFIYAKNEYIYKSKNFADEKREIELIKQLISTSLDKDFQNDFLSIEGIVTDIKSDPIRFKSSDFIENIFAAMLQYNCVIISDGVEKIYLPTPKKIPSIMKIFIFLFIVTISGVLLHFFKGLVSHTELAKIYLDYDRDGIGNIDSFIMSSESVDGYVTRSGDTNDNDPCIPDSSSKACKYNPNIGINSSPSLIKSKSCPSLNKNIGDLCDDGDSNTFDDRIDNKCICKGKTGAVTWYQDRDGDGIGNNNITKISNTVMTGYVTVFGDCNDNDENIRKIGDLCDDGNHETSNDRVQFDCSCKGFQKISTDSDGDGIANNKDKCPERKGLISKSGCPEIKIKTPGKIYKDQDVTIELEEFISLTGDIIKWSGTQNTSIFVNPNSIKTTLRMMKPGFNTIQVDVNGSKDGFSAYDSQKICVEYSSEELTKIIEKARIQGNYDPGTFIPSKVKTEANDALEILKEISASNIQVKENSTFFGNEIEDFILAKIMEPGSYLKSISVMPHYNTLTCKIERITFNMK